MNGAFGSSAFENFMMEIVVLSEIKLCFGGGGLERTTANRILLM